MMALIVQIFRWCVQPCRWQPKLFPLVLVLLMSWGIVLSSGALKPAVAQSTFSDPQNAWARDCIHALVQRQLMRGYGDGTFRPDAVVTRAEFASMVSNAFPALSPVRRPAAFKDVPPGYWASNAIQSAYQKGFLSGYTQDQFNPGAPIARAQALGALAAGLRYETTQPIAQTLSAFTDRTDIPGYAQTAIAAAVEHGLVVNYPHTSQLNPTQPMSRAGMAVALCRALPDLAATVPAAYVISPIAAQPQPTIQPISQPTQPTSQPATAPRTEIRGVWITNVDSAVLFDSAVLKDAVQQLAQLNFNTLYPVVWNWGYTTYPSAVAKQAIGASTDPRPIGLDGRNALAELVQQGHQHGIAVIPWFEFGFMAPEDSALAIRHADWLTQKQDGTTVWQEGIYPRVWLNPFKPEVQQFIQDLILELVSNYDIDGIQLDDHFGLPYEFGYDDYTVQLYQRENQGKSPPTNPKDPGWVRWRADKITRFTAQLFQAIKARKNDVLLTLSPNNDDFSYNNSLQDWTTWQQQGLIEELVLQVYGDDLRTFTAQLNTPAIQTARRHIPTGVGILTGLRNRPVPMQRIREQIQAVRQQGFAGVSFFFYETLWHLAAEPERDRKAVLQSLFSSPVPRPNVIQGWTPPN